MYWSFARRTLEHWSFVVELIVIVINWLMKHGYNIVGSLCSCDNVHSLPHTRICANGLSNWFCPSISLFCQFVSLKKIWIQTVLTGS